MTLQKFNGTSFGLSWPIGRYSRLSSQLLEFETRMPHFYSIFINVFLIFVEYLKIPEIDVFLPRLSLGTCYKWIHFDRKKCFDKMFFWPFVGNGFFWCPYHKVNTLSQQSVSCIDYLELRHFKKMKT